MITVSVKGGICMNVFRRRELKFLVDARQRLAIEELMRQRMESDRFGKSTVCNLYYDTPDYRLIRHSLEKPIYKEKLRLRSYGQIQSGVDVFLEMKKKYKGVVYKRRIRVTQEQAQDFLERRAPLPEDCQIAREMVYFRDFYEDLAPRVYLSYERQAWFSPEDPGFRVTLDRNIRFRTTDMSLYAPTGGQLILPEELSLLEVKASGGIPLWMAAHLSENHIQKQSFSKYGRAYQQLLREKLSESRGKTYA